MRRLLLCASLVLSGLAVAAALLPADAAKKAAPMSGMASMSNPAPMANPALKANATVTPGCAYQTIDVQKYGMKPYADAPVIHAGANHELHATLNIAYTDPSKTSIAGCPVKLRTYDGALVGPTLRVKGGDTMYITVVNDLPESVDTNGKPIPCPMQHNNMVQALNTTNLHTHGLHVSPSGISDNVFIEICGHKANTPPNKQDYKIEIPANHPAGTFWYHAHVHGSTAVQVSSAMEGAIIIEGNIDEVPQIKAMKEKVLLMQQISYDQNGQIESLELF